ncbi:hypothetical protein [Halomonas alkalisoli]|uniref:hypothetical protein n=1 Tax=Halomonas alkalisoli TaxID=2907158 RepID=UPI001F29432F|nr:hypothetical protein [Halomonas alkalisoli]MCE9681294.1 hypothetical protein [Halomonas alkalisoli]
MPRLLTFALLMLPLSALALEPEVQAAKDEGMPLYNAHLRSQAPPYLEPAAEAGDAEAMYYLGEIHRLRHMGMTREALEWYRRAAEHGEPYAMLWVSSAMLAATVAISLALPREA